MSTEKRSLQAQFYFVCMDPGELNRTVAHQAILDTFVLAGAKNYDDSRYSQFLAIVEDNGTVADSGKPLRPWNYPLPGEYYRSNFNTVSKILRRKYHDEQQYKRVPGHQSTHAPQRLNGQTLAIIIGSPEFLALNAVL